MVQMDYNSFGEVSLIRYYDAEEDAVMVDGAYGIRSDYNGYGNIELKTWLGADGEAMTNQEGYASIRYDYDLSNSEQVEKYFEYYQDTEGNAAAASNGAWGRSILYYPVTRIHEVTYTDQDGNPAMITDGYAVYQYEMDEHENIIWEGYFDEMSVPVNCSDGYASVEREFDEEGRLISERYLDRYNKLTNNNEGVAGWNGYYNDEGELVISNRYDQDRKTLQPEGEADNEG